MLARLQNGEEIPLAEFTKRYDPVTRVILESGGLFPFSKKIAAGAIKLPPHATGKRQMTMAEKMIAAKLLNPGTQGAFVQPGDAVLARVDAGYSHEFTTAQVHEFLRQEYGADYRVQNPHKLAVFEDHLLYADGVERMAPFAPKIQRLRDLQREFQRHTGVRDYGAVDGVSPGICHQVAREEFVDPGDFVQATDSHTCMGGGNNALSYGVGATEYAALAYGGFTFVQVPESIRFELHGALDAGCTAKDVMLHILDVYAKREDTLNRSMEFGGPGLASLHPDERATLCNMATECTARTGIAEGDRALAEWLAARRPGTSAAAFEARFVRPDAGATYAGGVHRIDLAAIRPMVAHPGDPDRGIPSDPTNGAAIADIGEVPIDIAYAGSCTAGKIEDFRYYAQVCAEREVLRPVRLAAGDGIRARAGLDRALRARRRHRDHARLRRLHRLRPRRQRPARSGDGVGDQSQLPGPQRSRPALAGQPADGRRERLRRAHRSLRGGRPGGRRRVLPPLS
jgi:3-isopropylmalate/(R)-2-methylmalate dehydratase large subunit